MCFYDVLFSSFVHTVYLLLQQFCCFTLLVLIIGLFDFLGGGVWALGLLLWSGTQLFRTSSHDMTLAIN